MKFAPRKIASKRKASTLALAIGAAFFATGCSPDGTDPKNETAHAASMEAAGEDLPSVPEVDPTPIGDADDQASSGRAFEFRDSRSMGGNSGMTDPAPVTNQTPSGIPVLLGQGSDTDGVQDLVPTPDATPQRRVLDDAMTVPQLARYLRQSNDDMQKLMTGVSGITDENKLIATINEVLDAKLQASKLLTDHPEASGSQKITGLRSQIQTLSHLASNGNVTAAEQLEDLVTKHQSHSNTQVALDSSLVLIGFGAEKVLQSKDGAADALVTTIQDFVSQDPPQDIAALMVLGKSRDALSQMDHPEKAATVRQLIIDRFVNSEDVQIADLAKRIVGSAKGDKFDRLLRKLIGGKDVPVDEFTTEAETLASEATDIQTVQYLGGAAVELEGLGFEKHADIVYEQLKTQFTDDAALAGAAKTAVDAYKNRLEIIGKTFDPDFAAVDGSPLSLKDYRGKVVLMPFWSANFVDSMRMIPQLQKIADANPAVEIVGVNMDPVDGDVISNFAKNSGIQFPSFHTVDTANMQAVGTRFGIVTMPFTAIIAPDGKVAAVNFTGTKLDETVVELLQ